MRSVRSLALLALLALVVALAAPVGSRAARQEGSPVASPTAGDDACAMTAGGMAMATPAVEADLDPTTLDLDLLYIDILIPHHEMAVQMAEIARARSVRTEVIALAGEIIEIQSREIDQLRAWREAWYPDAPALTETQVFAGLETKASSPGRGGAPGLSELTMAGMELAMAELCEETELFDLAFIVHMVEHHTGAVLISQLVVEQAVHPEMREFAQEVIDVQGAEITRMLSWRDAWFGGIPLEDHHGGDEGTPTG